MEFNFENYKCFEFSAGDENIQEEVKEEKDIFESSLINNSKNEDTDNRFERMIEDYEEKFFLSAFGVPIYETEIVCRMDWFKHDARQRLYLEMAYNNLKDKLPKGIAIRPAKESDSDKMFEYEMDSIDTSLKKDPEVIKLIKDDVKDSIENTKMIIVMKHNNLTDKDEEDKVIGMVTTSIIDDDWLYIGEIFLESEYRGKGIGSIILNDLISQYDKIKLQVAFSNEKAIKLYKSLGFTIHKTDEKNKMYVMKLDKRFQIRSERFQEREIGLSLSFNEDYRYIVDSSVDLILEAKHRKHRGGTPKAKLSNEELINKSLKNAASKISIYNPNQKRNDNTKHLKNKNLIEAFIRNFNAQKIKDNPSMEIFDSYKINLSGIDVCCQIEMNDNAPNAFKGSIAGGVYTHKYEVYIDKDKTKTPYNCIYVYLAPEFFRLSYNSQLSALYHEIGHYMMQNETEKENMSESDKIKQKNFYKHAKKYIDGIHDKGEHEIEADHFAANRVGEKNYNKLLRAIISSAKKDIYEDLFKKEKERLIKEIKENPNNLKIMELKLKEFKGLTNKNTISKKNIDQFIDNYIDEFLNSIKPEFHKAVNQDLNLKLNKIDVAQRLRAIYNKKLRTLAKYGNMEYHNESYKIDDIIELWDNTNISIDGEVRYLIND